MGTALLKQVQYLKENGFTEQQANTLVYFHKDSIEGTLATKKDIEQLRADTKKDIEQLRADTKKDIAEVKRDIEYVKKDIEQLRADTKKDIAEVKKDIEHLRVELKQDIILLKKDLTVKLGGIMTGGVVLLGVLLSILIKF